MHRLEIVLPIPKPNKLTKALFFSRFSFELYPTENDVQARNRRCHRYELASIGEQILAAGRITIVRVEGLLVVDQ